MTEGVAPKNKLHDKIEDSLTSDFDHRLDEKDGNETSCHMGDSDKIMEDIKTFTTFERDLSNFTQSRTVRTKQQIKVTIIHSILRLVSKQMTNPRIHSFPLSSTDNKTIITRLVHLSFYKVLPTCRGKHPLPNHRFPVTDSNACKKRFGTSWISVLNQ